MSLTISGAGHNSTITLYGIHHGMGSFRQDTGTVHSQVKLLQQELTNQGYDTKGADGKYGKNTVSAVKAFQQASDLTADGYFGKKSLTELEDLIGAHLDPENCEVSTGTDTVKNYTDKSDKYKIMNTTRINSYADASEKIYAFTGQGNPLTWQSYKTKLESYAANSSILYANKDCANYLYAARKSQGAKGATSNFTRESKFFGHIVDLGGINKLVPGMEVYQAVRKTASSNLFYAGHIGVYAGLYDFKNGEGPVPAVYQSSPSYSNLPKKYTKSSGPNLTKMMDDNRWTYWGWSKYIRVR